MQNIVCVESSKRVYIGSQESERDEHLARTSPEVKACDRRVGMIGLFF